MKTEKCCFCKKSIIGYGNNPAPVKESGRCCDECNRNIVIPARFIATIKKKMNNILTTVTKPNIQYHRKPFIIHTVDSNFYLAEFETEEQLKFFLDTLGVKIAQEVEKRESDLLGVYTRYELSHRIEGDNGFLSLEEIPQNAKPIKALSNGSIVTCYYLNDGETVKIYRPNPNKKEIYKPLSTEEHIKHVQIYGLY